MTTRRTFLQGAAGALGLSGALAGSAAQAMPTERPKKFDEDYDVIVVGAAVPAWLPLRMRQKKDCVC